MKYYCKNCGCEVIPGKPSERSAALELVCPWCGRKILSISPAYETVAAWEKRKGEKYPDTAPVYTDGYGGGVWHLREWQEMFQEFARLTVVATEAGAPPDDWRPE